MRGLFRATINNLGPRGNRIAQVARHTVGDTVRYAVRYAVRYTVRYAVRYTVVFVLTTVLLPLRAVAQSGATSSREQVVLSRAEAHALAATHAPRSILARVDSLSARADLRRASQFENPIASASYSKSEPQAHFALDVPFDWPGTRSTRITAARFARDAVTLRITLARASLALDVDTAYTRAQVGQVRALLSSRTAQGADSLLMIARLRRDAGDASDLDVALAQVFAGQSHMIAASDSLLATNAVFLLQTIVGLRADSVTLTLGDQLTLNNNGLVRDNSSEAAAPGAATGRSMPRAPTLATASTITVTPSTATAPLPLTASADAPEELQRTPSNAAPSYASVAAARDADAARSRVILQQRHWFSSPSLSVGFERAGPTTTGLLPTVGLALPLPLFNRNRAAIDAAFADLARARATVVAAQLEQSTTRFAAANEAAASHARLIRSQELVADANRIAALSLIAYREGAATLASVLEAQRTARETISQYVDDVAATRIADRVQQFLLLSPEIPTS